MAIPNQPPSPMPPGQPPSGGPPGQPASGGADGQDGEGKEVIDALKVLTMFAQAQKQQGNDGPAQALQVFMQAISGQDKMQEPGAPGPAGQKQMSQMPMNSAKGASPVM